MPAANSTPCDDPAPDPVEATVLHMANHAGRQRRHTPGGTETPSARAPAATPPPGGVDPVADRIGAQVQALFSYHGRTLTDPETADVMRITMDGVIGLIDGALAKEVISPEAHSMIKATLEGMRDVPRTL
jgi:hypothetical protein